MTQTPRVDHFELAVEHARYVSWPNGGGEILGRFTDVKGQRDGKWVYLMDHGSVPLMPPPAPPAAPTTN